MSDRKVAIVTGATQGLGRLVGEELVRRGFAVVANARRRDPPGFGEQLYRAFDVADPGAVDRFVHETVARFHRVDLLVNNAGFANPSTPLSATDDEVLARCVATNLLGPAAFMKRVLPQMASQADGGLVLNIASRAGITPIPGLAAYSASKSALVSFTLAAAKEYPGGKVLCLALCPAGMNTEMRAKVYGAEDAATSMDPRRVRDVVMELATQRTVDGASPPTGSAVLIDPEGRSTVLVWPNDTRGFPSLRFG
jgi:3-oxoacyl-[acyl-carrier protein] reductase